MAKSLSQKEKEVLTYFSVPRDLQNIPSDVQKELQRILTFNKQKRESLYLSFLAEWISTSAKNYQTPKKDPVSMFGVFHEIWKILSPAYEAVKTTRKSIYRLIIQKEIESGNRSTYVDDGIVIPIITQIIGDKWKGPILSNVHPWKVNFLCTDSFDAGLEYIEDNKPFIWLRCPNDPEIYFRREFNPVLLECFERLGETPTKLTKFSIHFYEHKSDSIYIVVIDEPRKPLVKSTTKQKS